MNQVADRQLHFSDPGLEIVKHVRHGHRYFLSTNLQSAFDQVTLRRLEKALRFREINPSLVIPREYFFHEKGLGGLIQGAPSSPYLFETYCRFGGLDRELFEYCEKLEFYYSRYVDDILISSPREIGRRIGSSVRKIVGKYGFTLSDKKTKRVDVHMEPLEVLGYVILGTRIDASPEVMDKLHEIDRDELSRTGLFRWRRHVRALNRRTK